MIPILEARMLEAAKEQHNRDVTGMSVSMAKLWAEMLEAMRG